MIIKEIHIDSFGCLENRDFYLSDGLNIVYGENESGKSTLAAFIKFMLYGLSGRASDKGISERRRYVSLKSGTASGTMTAETGAGTVKIERSLSVSAKYTQDCAKENIRETVLVSDAVSGAPLKLQGGVGESLLGIPEDVFINTIFVRQGETDVFDKARMKSALENIMFSANENISIQKALKILDARRRSLLHKNENGGLIFDLREEERLAEEALGRSSAYGNELILCECSLEEINRKRVQTEEQIEHLKKLTDAYETVRLIRLSEDVTEAKAKQEQLSGKLSAFDASHTDKSLRERISRCAYDIKNTEEELSVLLEKKAQIDKTLSSDKIIVSQSVDNAEEKYTSCSAAKRTFKTLGITAILLSAVAIGLFIFFSTVKTGISAVFSSAHIISAASAAVLLAAAAIMLYLSSKYKKEADKILSEWGADSLSALKNILSLVRIKKQDVHILEAQARDTGIKINQYREKLSQCMLRADETAGEILKLQGYKDDENKSPEANASGTDSADVLEKLRLAQEMYDKSIEERNELTGEISRAEAVINANLAQLRGIDENELRRQAEAYRGSDIWEKAKSLDIDQVSKIKSQLRFSEGQHKSQIERTTELERRFSALKALRTSPAEEAEKLRQIKEVLTEKTKEYEACILAARTLETAGEKIRSDILPGIVRKASGCFSIITDGKYEMLGASADFDLTVKREGRSLTSDFLSGGSEDAAYVSLRRALCSVILRNEAPLQIYDESFCQLDDKRLKNVLNILSSDRSQSIVFTCRKDELTGAGTASVIRL